MFLSQFCQFPLLQGNSAHVTPRDLVLCVLRRPIESIRDRYGETRGRRSVRKTMNMGQWASFSTRRSVIAICEDVAFAQVTGIGRLRGISVVLALYFTSPLRSVVDRRATRKSCLRTGGA